MGRNKTSAPGAGLVGLAFAAGIAGSLLGAVAAPPAHAFDAERLETLARNAAFSQFIADLWPDARRRGVSRKTFNAAFHALEPDARIKRRQAKQAEFVTPLWTYMEKRVTSARISKGKMHLKSRARTLDTIERRFGVDRHVVLAVWGMETNYGSFTGKKSVVRSLATMAFEGGRKVYGRKQLLAALDILQSGDVRLSQFKGSWAGAMGHTQFIPITYNAYAVDMTGDGKRDIWNSVADALGSTAHYLKRRGWKRGTPWGWEVALPRGFNYRLAGKAGARSVAKWARLGVRPAGGGNFGTSTTQAELLLPVGRYGPAFLVTGNYKAILAYNRSNAYALSVAHLADRISGDGPLRTPWPTGLKLLSRSNTKELQELLSARGYNTGGTSGLVGPRTRSAISSYQHQAGLTPDGYADASLLERLRRGL